MTDYRRIADRLQKRRGPPATVELHRQCNSILECDLDESDVHYPTLLILCWTAIVGFFLLWILGVLTGFVLWSFGRLP